MRSVFIIKKIFLNLLALLIGLITLIPFVWMVSASLMKTGESAKYPPKFFPSELDFSHYIFLFQNLDMAKYFLNSLALAILVTTISLLFNSMAAYAFAKLRFGLKDRLFKFLLSLMIVPGQVTMLPLFLMLKELGFINTYFGIIIPGMAGVFGIFLLRQFMMSIPDSLIDAARIDGASDLKIFFTIILPLCRSVLITLGIFTFIGTWNDFLWPLIVMTDSSMYTLPVALANLMGEHTQDTELMMAGSVITVLPIVILFAFVQKYYISGIMVGSVKE
ncbi:MAG: carbohydrate ABC transporter permease [Ignavibacteria bacterium]|nr:carbohydrate ABC transporter permease [Ignavibacteria bacterium]